MLTVKTTISLLVTGMLSASAYAGGVTYKDGDKFVKLGGRIHLQYHQEDPAEGESEDDLFFRRLRPYIEGSVHKDWKGKFQFDFGKNSTEIKDAYLQYKGSDAATVSFGNKTFPFSREQLTSSKKQHLVERTFVGDHNYGTPDRNVGIHLDGGIAEDLITWGAAAGFAAVDPDNKKLDLDTTASLNRGDDWVEGAIIGGRIEISPFGPIKFEQGNFGDGEFKASLGLGVFTWSNDNDYRNEIELDDEGAQALGKQDVDRITGFEVSAAFRFAGVSLDAQYNSFDTELVDGGVSNGIYKDSESTLENMAIEGGVMVVPEKLELVAGYSSQDADGYATEWNRTEIGANYFFKKQDIKIQTTYRMGENKDGKNGKDVDETFVQFQYVF